MKDKNRKSETNSAVNANKKIQQEFYGDDERDDITHLGYFINSVDHNKRRE